MRKKKMTESFALKTAVFIMTILFLCVAALGLGITVMLEQEGFYEQSKEQLIAEGMAEQVMEDAKAILQLLSADLEEEALIYCKDRNVSFQVLDQKGKVCAGSYSPVDAYIYSVYAQTEAPVFLKMVYDSEIYRSPVYSAEEISFLENGKCLRLYVPKMLERTDLLQQTERLFQFCYTWRYLFLIAAGASLLLALTGFLFLMCAAGQRFGKETVEVRGIFALPFDLLTVGVLAAEACLIAGIGELFPGRTLIDGIFLLSLFLLGCSIGLGYCMIGSVQGKAGILFRNMLIGRIWFGCVALCRFLIQALRSLIKGLPDILQVLIVLAGLLIAEGFLLIITGWHPTSILLIGCLEKLLLIPFVIYLALVVGKLVKGSANLAEGNLNYQIDTDRMFGTLKEHGENLNRIADGMNTAVEERLKSERLKTELITNVSHDIKTPLTSIINYAELITEEQTDNEKIKEYSQVLMRQSVRLKKLIDDLMEASKASTGNVEVHMMPCEVNVLLTQTLGEYEHRLEELGLELICKQPEDPVRIMADGKLLWRVFDNLMNNICKYALGGTRVYLTLEQTAGEAVISFKNISRYPLEISAQELQERFVRGDRSRHTEGNGLGLSISQSLTVLQNGRLELTVDGDFFKVVLRFGLLNELKDR